MARQTIKFQNHSAHEFMAAKIKVHRSISQAISAVLEPYGLTISEWLALGYINDNDGSTTMRDLANELDVSAPFITKLLKAMAKRHLITFTPGFIDKRTRYLTLTESGKNNLKKCEQAVVTSLTQWLEQIPRKDVATYTRTELSLGASKV